MYVNFLHLIKKASAFSILLKPELGYSFIVQTLRAIVANFFRLQRMPIYLVLGRLHVNRSARVEIRIVKRFFLPEGIGSISATNHFEGCHKSEERPERTCSPPFLVAFSCSALRGLSRDVCVRSTDKKVFSIGIYQSQMPLKKKFCGKLNL